MGDIKLKPKSAPRKIKYARAGWDGYLDWNSECEAMWGILSDRSFLYERDKEFIEISRYEPRVISPDDLSADKILETVLEKLDNRYQYEDGFAPTLKMQDAAEALKRVILDEYVVNAYDEVSTKVIDVEKFKREHDRCRRIICRDEDTFGGHLGNDGVHYALLAQDKKGEKYVPRCGWDWTPWDNRRIETVVIREDVPMYESGCEKCIDMVERYGHSLSDALGKEFRKVPVAVRMTQDRVREIDKCGYQKTT